MAEDFLLKPAEGITAAHADAGRVLHRLARQIHRQPQPAAARVPGGRGHGVRVPVLGLVRFLLNQPVGGFGELLRVALLVAAYNAVLTPILFPSSGV